MGRMRGFAGWSVWGLAVAVRRIGAPPTSAAELSVRRGAVLSARGGRCAAVAVLVSGLVALLAAAPGARGAYYPDDVIAGQATSGNAVGQLGALRPLGVAVNDSSVSDGALDPQGASANGYVYVADSRNERIQVFTSDGEFRFLFGKGVTGGAVGEVCDLTETCSPASAGGGAGEFAAPQGVAVNQQTGDVYVAELNGRRVQQFKADGTFVRAWGRGVDDGSDAFQVCDAPIDLPCQAGLAGKSGGQFTSASTTSRTMDIAVSPAAPHHVFVGDPGNGRLHEYAPDGSFVRLWGWNVVNTGQPGDIGPDSFEICTSTATGVCNAYTPGSQDTEMSGRFGAEGPGSIAIDGTTGVVYATSIAPWAANVQRFDSTKTAPADLLLSPFAGIAGLAGGNALAVRPSTGNLLVARGVNGIQELSTSSDPVVEVGRHLESGSMSLRDIAVDVGTDRFFLSTSDLGARVFRAVEGGAGPAGMTIDEPIVVGGDGTSATFSGTVDPGGPAGFNTDYDFQYSRDGVNWVTVPGSENPLGDGTDPIAVSDDVVGLEQGSIYQVRLRTRKAFGNPFAYSAPVSFRTADRAPAAETVHPQAIGQSSATITGLVNPFNRPTSYYFEWGTDTSYGNQAPIPAGDAGSDFGMRPVSVQLQGLQPATTYHYRVVADNGIEVEGSPGETEVRSADQSFTTRSVAPGLAGRAFELVSPADKLGGVGVGFWPGGLGHIATAGAAAHVGERFAVSAQYGSVLDGNGGFSFSSDWTFAERSQDGRGWLSKSPLTHPIYKPATAQPVELRAGSGDLSLISWKAPSSLAIFPEMADAGDLSNDRPGWGNFGSGMVSDWGGPFGNPTRWELFGPANLDQVADDSLLASTAQGTFRPIAVSGGGSAAVGVTSLASNNLPEVHGLAGADDPTWPSPAQTPGVPAYGDLVAGRSIYYADFSAGLADSFATGERKLVNVCTGTAGVDRTMLPAVGAGGDLEELECPAGIGGRDRLISNRGATLAPGTKALDGMVSDDGSRVFFLAPDPSGSPPSSCIGTGGASSCPPQLYVRQRNPGGGVVTRWISKAEDGLFAGQDASLTGTVRFEGASADGSRVYFRTDSPLTADDPNGAGAPVAGGVKTGTPDPESWDLYMVELADGPDPTGSGSTTTRISAGPGGDGDCNSPFGGSDGAVGALRFLSDDGARAYFTCQAPLPGVDAPAGGGGITTPGGTPTEAGQTNLYLYDHNRIQPDRWRFVARLPRSTNGTLSDCATTGLERRTPFKARDGANPEIVSNAPRSNCVSGTADGGFVTLFTEGRLTGDDSPAGATADIYAYDAAADSLARITAPQGGDGTTYPCLQDSPGTPVDESLLYSCHGDGGVDEHNGLLMEAPGPSHLGVATDPLVVGDRVAFFQSASRLVAEDLDDGYDVYEWRNGELSLLTDGAVGSEDALYKGNDSTGTNVYFSTRQALTWQDKDVVADVYTARVGGGVAEPAAPGVCLVLSDGCQGAGAASVAAQPQSTRAGGGDATSRRRSLVVPRPGQAALRRAARSGVLVLRVRVGGAGVVRGLARARLSVNGKPRRVAAARARASGAGVVKLRLRLSRPAVRRLRAARKLALAVRVSATGAGSRSMRLSLRRIGK